MKDFTMVTPPHWTFGAWIIIIIAIVFAVVWIKLLREAFRTGEDIALTVSLGIFLIAMSLFVLYVVVTLTGTGLKKAEYQGEFKVVQNKISNGGLQDGYNITLADKNGRQQTFENGSSEKLKDIKKGDKVILKVEMPFDKEPVWTKSIDEQGGEVVALKKSDN